MRNHIQRVIERRDRRDRPNRFAHRIDPPLFSVRRQIAGKYLPVIQNSQLTGQSEHIVTATGFIQRVLLANPQFQRQPMGNLSRRSRIISPARNRIC